jgi:Mn-dependent DtxR family transcriptional regulator
MNFEREDRKQRLARDRRSTESEEDYLASILELLERKGYARVADVAQSLSVVEPSACEMIKRLAQKGYLTREKYRGFTLTESGQAKADEVLTRRRTLMAFLQSLGLPQNVIIRDVHGLEHHLSEKTLQCFKRLMKAD